MVFSRTDYSICLNTVNIWSNSIRAFENKIRKRHNSIYTACLKFVCSLLTSLKQKFQHWDPNILFDFLSFSDWKLWFYKTYFIQLERNWTDIPIYLRQKEWIWKENIWYQLWMCRFVSQYHNNKTISLKLAYEINEIMKHTKFRRK